MKKSLLALATLICLSFVPAQATSLVQMDIKKTSDNTVDMTFFTSGNSSNPMVTRKSENKYVILMPNVSGKSTSAPDISKLRDIIADVNVKNVDDGMAGYTKVTVITTKPLNINTHTQTSGHVTTEERAAKDIIANIKTTPSTDKTTQAVSAKTETKTPEKKIGTVAIKTTNAEQNKVKTVQKSFAKSKQENIIQPKATIAVIPKNIETEAVFEETRVPEVQTQEAQTLNNNIEATTVQNNGVKSKVKNKIKNNSSLLLLAFPLLLLYALSKMLKKSTETSNTVKLPTVEDIEQTVKAESNYDSIMTEKDLNWQERYKKFMGKSESKVNRTKYNFVTSYDPISKTDTKRLQLENTFKETPEIYKNQTIDISNNPFKEVVSEDDSIQENLNSIKLKAFAKPASLTSSHRANVSKLLPKYSHAKEGKFVKLYETPLNSTSRKFQNANLKVADLVSKGNKYLPKEVQVNSSNDYIMSSIDEYFSLLDKEKARKTATNSDLSQKVAKSLANVKPSMKKKSNNAIQVSNPIRQKSNNHMDGLIIKESYTIDRNRSFHLVNMDGMTSLIGRINDDITVIKNFNNKAENLQVRPDNENVYMIRVNEFKALVDANNMGILIEL